MSISFSYEIEIVDDPTPGFGSYSPNAECQYINLEIVYNRHDTDVEILEVLEEGGEPLSDDFYKMFEDDIIEAAREHMFTEDAEAQDFGNKADRAYERARERSWDL